MGFVVEPAVTPAQYEAAREIFQRYARFLGLDLEYQGFTDELATLDRMYGPPRGCLLLARKGEEFVGVVGLREFESGVAEMKRMYVLPEHQGEGIGSALTRAFIEQAGELGYRCIRLDSVRSLHRAIELYRKFGFEETEPYRYNPYPDAVYMEYRLSFRAGRGT